VTWLWGVLIALAVWTVARYVIYDAARLAAMGWGAGREAYANDWYRRKLDSTFKKED
jgi:hypothetical protein